VTVLVFEYEDCEEKHDRMQREYLRTAEQQAAYAGGKCQEPDEDTGGL